MTPFGSAWQRFAEGRVSRVAEGDSPRSPSSVDDETADAAYLGWEVSRCVPGLGPDETAAVAALAAACLVALRAGSTRVPADMDRLGETLASVDAAHLVDVADALLTRARGGRRDDPVVQVIGRPGGRTPLVVDGSWLSTERMLRFESEFCVRVGRLMARPTSLPDDATVERILRVAAEGPPPLTDEQLTAVRAALSRPLALITGGPGTGKTTVMAALLGALGSGTAAGVALAAPTGKAALRMREALETRGRTPGSPTPTATTLHRLLGWSPAKGTFARDERDPLPYRLVVVDEASMIDLALMNRLLRALPIDARLVLLGDVDQLPSVDAGAVFRDLCRALEPATLTVNLRVAREPAARSLVAVAEAIQRGVFAEHSMDAIASQRPVRDLVFEGVERLPEPWTTVGDAVLERWWDARIRSLAEFEGRLTRVHRAPNAEFDEESVGALRTLCQHYANSRLLCAARSRHHATGSEALNDRLLVRLRSATGSPRSRHSGELPPGTPVLTERNDYDRELWNGDQGVVAWVDAGRGPELRAVFPRAQTFVHFPVEDLSALTPAFATTVHKAQGSEFDHVAVVLPEIGSPLSTRELLYTAVTRARRSVLLVGEPERLAHAASHSVARDTGVAERLATIIA